jgi:hypothetical protein
MMQELGTGISSLDPAAADQGIKMKKSGLKMYADPNRIQKEVLNREISRCSYHRFLNRYFTQKVVTWSVDLFKRTGHPKTQKPKACKTDYLRLIKPPVKE